MPCQRIRLSTSLAILLLSSSILQAQSWSRFRGPNGSGVSTARNVPVDFGPDRNVEWQTDVPFGRSSPALSHSRIFLTAVEDDKLTTLALDRSTGELVWKRAIQRARVTEMYPANDSATPTPVTDGANVYVFFQEAGLISYDPAGRERWRVDMGPFRNFYGMASSPVLAGESLLLVSDQVSGSFLVALDTSSGEILWRQERPGRVESYTTPVLYPDAVNPQSVLIAGSKWIDAYDLATGEALWSLSGVGAGPVSSPVLAGDLLFVNAPDHVAEPLEPFSQLTEAHDADGDGRLSREEVAEIWIHNHFGFVDIDGDGQISREDWDDFEGELTSDHWGLYALRLPADGGRPEFLWNCRQSVAYIPSVLAYEGVVYMAKGSILSAYDAETGELLKRGRIEKGGKDVYASPIAAEGRIYIGTLGGKLAVLDAGAEWRVLALNDLGEEIFATPAVADGHLYVRTRGKLYSFSSEAAATDAGDHE